MQFFREYWPNSTQLSLTVALIWHHMTYCIANTITDHMIMLLNMDWSCFRFKTLNDINSNHYTLFHSGTRWLSSAVDFMAMVMTLLVTLFVVLSDNAVISPSLKGLALSYTIQVHLGSKQWDWTYIAGSFVDSLCWCVFQLTVMLQYVVRLGTEVEARFSSVERLLEYISVTAWKFSAADAFCLGCNLSEYSVH